MTATGIHKNDLVATFLGQFITRLLYWLLVVLALILPFEIIRPLLVLPWFELSNLQLVATVAVVAWFAHVTYLVIYCQGVATISTPLRGYVPILLPATLFLAFAGLSALLTPENRTEGLKIASRFAMCFGVAILTVYLITTPTRVQKLLWAIVIGSGISATLGLMEGIGWDRMNPLFGLFKEAPTRVGGQIRISGSFQYATIASMFWEMTIPLALALAATAQNTRRALLAMGIAVVSITAVVQTLTRAGLLTLGVMLGLLLFLAWRQREFRSLLRPTALAAAALLSVVAGLLLYDDVFHTRLVTENDMTWYDARYRAPGYIDLPPGDTAAVTVEVQNTGNAHWFADGAHSFALGYRWLTGDRQEIPEASHFEISLPHNVAPGETVHISAEIQAALPPGNYRIAWSMLQRHILWFYHRGVPEAETIVRIGAGSPAEQSMPSADPVQEGDSSIANARAHEQFSIPPTVPRRQLWLAAVRMWAAHPLFGVGPGNFRLLYGRYIGMPEWDERIHSNNLYLELLANQGLMGVVTFAWLMLAIGVHSVRSLKARVTANASEHSPSAVSILWSIGLASSLLAFLTHGVFDYFLAFTSVNLLFGVIVGLSIAVTRLAKPA